MSLTAGRPGGVRMSSLGMAFGTFGELLQGVLPEEWTDFLVTLPIACWSWASFLHHPGGQAIRVWPAHKTKALRLAQLMLVDAGRPEVGLLRLDNRLPEGKGMASSSADLVATARAVSGAIAVPVTPAYIESLLRQIEPSDGVMYNGVVAFEHRAVRLRAHLGALPPLTVVGVDEGGHVDTIEFNRTAKPFGAAEAAEYAELLNRLTVAVRAGDLVTVGRVATRSAVLNQRLHRKRTLDAMADGCRSIGGLGVAVAHSGTMVGILLADDDRAYAAKLDAARRMCLRVARNVAVYHTASFDRWQ